MTADEMLTELAKGLEQRLENQAQWHALVLRLEAWRAEARIAGHNSAVEAMQAQLEDAVSAERQDAADRALAFVLARGPGAAWTARDLYDAIMLVSR